MQQILLIIPCYNEESRIDLNHFHNFQKNLPSQAISRNYQIYYLFANDGSKDQTANKISNFIQQNQLSGTWAIFNNPTNTGKANVISNAYRWQKQNLNLSFDWVGYWDADLATPLYEIFNMLSYRDLFYPEKKAIFASRVLKLGSRIIRKPLRHYLGRVFATAVYLALRVGSYDSQCGAKLFSKDIADLALSENFISPWIFDVEIMLRIKEQHITEYPLKEWEDIPGSKIKIFKEAFRVLNHLYKIRQAYLKN